MTFNSLRSWPHVHLCLLDRSCWVDMWRYGMPMRLHHKTRFWDVPGPTAWLSRWRDRVVWGDAVPIEVAAGPPGTSALPADRDEPPS